MNWQDEHSCYLLLELCKVDLCAVLYGTDEQAGHANMPETWARVYVASIVLALRHLHQHGFVFRDLKLENVLLDAKGYAKLTDLGSARRLKYAAAHPDALAAVRRAAPPTSSTSHG